MKKFTKILICVLLCVFTIGLTACGKKDDFNYPTANMQTIGNGGMVVRKGNYVYFVNGYLAVDDSTMPETDKKKTFSVGSLVVAKLNDDGTINKNENDLMNDSYYRTISNKLCGFKATGLFIFGDYLYFTSACQGEDSSGNYARERVDFNRIKLDNSSGVEKIYTSEVTNANVEFSFFNNGAETYLVVYEKGDNLDNNNKKQKISNRVVSINVGNKKLGSLQTVSEDVTSIILKSDTQSNLGENIFYVKNNKEIKKYNVFNNSSTDFITEENTVTLRFVGGNKVFYETQVDGTQDLLYADVNSKIKTDFIWDVSNFSSTHLVKFANRFRVICINNDSSGSYIEYFEVDDSSKMQTQKLYVTDKDATTINVLGFKQDGIMLYYDNNNVIKAIDLSLNPETNPQINIITIAKIDGLKTDGFDFDEDYVYFYLTVGSNEYLHRLSLKNVSADEKAEFIGVYDANDVPEVDENEK